MAPPAGTSSANRRFILTRLDGGVETNVTIGATLSTNYTTDQTARATALTNARTLRTANPSVVYILYSPAAGAYWTNGDRVWRSDLSP